MRDVGSEKSGLSGCQPAAGGYMLRDPRWQQGERIGFLLTLGDITSLADKSAVCNWEDVINVPYGSH